jgi:hypothetical protein
LATTGIARRQRRSEPKTSDQQFQADSERLKHLFCEQQKVGSHPPGSTTSAKKRSQEVKMRTDASETNQLAVFFEPQQIKQTNFSKKSQPPAIWRPPVLQGGKAEPQQNQQPILSG